MRDNIKNTIDRRNFVKAAGLTSTLGVAGVSGCLGGGESDQGRDTFKFGAVTSLSGDLRFGGEVTRRGYDLWKKTVNDNGGIEIDGSSYEVELTYADAQSDPSTGADAASQMINNEGVDAVLGPYSSNVTLAVAPIMEKNQTPHITGSAESPRIWGEQYNHTFGTVPAVTQIARQTADEILSLDPAAESVYVSGVNGPFSEATASAMRAAAEDRNVEVLDYSLNPSDTDWTNVVSSAKDQDPDLHFHGGHIGSHVSLLNAADQLNYQPNGFFCHYGVNTSSFREGLGDGATNTFGATVWLPSVERAGGVLFGSAADYAEASRNEFDAEPDYTQAGSSAAGIVYQQALEELGAAPPLSASEQSQLVSIIEDIEVETFYGDVTFDKEGEFYHNNTTTDPLPIQLQDDNEAVVVGSSASASDANYPVSE
ncbi:amino acid ABC transporter substrate-binding protein [Halorientalis litorea]|jgi:branched-chain amino acid transport system substrate-binding protein|uniref:amino acid ABC transporter substrate-binding protein n=1 Tax=Halorientalis litorea TaxID=2931977 RepID=UPI001FF34A40|nr:amino acid ABC transporter substrate-binding protein [Halorientalis litorea]